MLFNSFEFIFIFLPITLLCYFLLGKLPQYIYAKIWLITTSLFFYGYWNVSYLPIIIISILVNYVLATAVSHNKISSTIGLLYGISLNVSLLAYYKYANFIFDTYTTFFNTSYSLNVIELPLAISFFTFQQIAYQVDIRRGVIKNNNFIDYCLFVLFFPQLIAGPIVHHTNMLPQFKNPASRLFKLENVTAGISLFTIGLFKKIVVADTFGAWASSGYAGSATASFLEAWLAILSYTLQIYFDFSGYSDMAIGAALCFNIMLPINFFSPYKALSIQDFWRRWHITLSTWLKDYLYIPLGGNRISSTRTYLNLFVTFLLGGLWHGAGWTFIFWGFLHGSALCVHRIWTRLTLYKLPKSVAWVITFLFIALAWVTFRAPTITVAFDIYSAAFASGSIGKWGHVRYEILTCIVGVLFVCITPNSIQMVMDSTTQKPKFTYGLAIAGSFAAISTCLLTLWMENRVSEFLYFQF
ncbi:MBOAT family O-acyltransferase [Halodesulfovibrio sp.]|uniref:MBOAT family O-acyltransferase n=1 Tax=Halodesulfovibrio sp. TaxID=1912772 RepID=UPI0025E66043|nr:MBOAT family O-acyltransferase [Halodesulfovibrio sp.]MCT4533923.1 MBOAT family protein [Halodesulfovibrio sp.]